MHKILIVDDEPEIVKILEEFLAKMGFEVTSAVGGEKGLENINSQAKIDLMVLDMKMPKVKGMDILRGLKQVNRNIPVIILTGSIDEQKHKEELEELGYGLADIQHKPVDLYRLLDAVKKKLGIKS